MSASQSYCTACGDPVQPGDRHCVSCGAALDVEHGAVGGQASANADASGDSSDAIVLGFVAGFVAAGVGFFALAPVDPMLALVSAAALLFGVAALVADQVG